MIMKIRWNEFFYISFKQVFFYNSVGICNFLKYKIIEKIFHQPVFFHWWIKISYLDFCSIYSSSSLPIMEIYCVYLLSLCLYTGFSHCALLVQLCDIWHSFCHFGLWVLWVMLTLIFYRLFRMFLDWLKYFSAKMQILHLDTNFIGVAYLFCNTFLKTQIYFTLNVLYNFLQSLIKK